LQATKNITLLEDRMTRYRLLLAFGAVLLLALFGVGLARAAAPTPTPPANSQNQSCLTCHTNPSLSTKLPSGETLALFVDQAVYNASVHGRQGFACASCHPTIQSYPHPKLAVSTVREYQLQQYHACAQCHNDVYQSTQDSMHAQLLAAGNLNAAICTDCHGAHDVTLPDQPRTKIPLACAKCHAGIYDEYASSVHGQALTTGNPDVPTCVDCHGVHTMLDPRTVRFRLNSPQLCARCHADANMMAKYGISTNVFNTYVSDFHGTTVTLFQRQSPDLPTNKPVCYDCHGVHNMQKITAENSPVFKANLLRICQRCHPNATANFPASWLSHYEPSLQRFPLIYYVSLFYRIMIPLIIGLMVLYVLIEIISRTIRRSRASGNGGER
jgi:predicted CXXCH cytochrome family protein